MRPESRPDIQAAWGLLAAGMVLRLVWATVVAVVPQSDSIAYDTFAMNMLEHGVYGWTAGEPTAYWPVGTSAVTALAYALLGRGDLAVELPNLVAGAVLMRMTYLLGRLWFGPAVGLASLALVAFWPNLIFFTTVLSSELFFLALTTSGLWLWSRRRGTPDLVLAGILWGLACYVRPVILLLPAALALAELRLGPRAAMAAAVRAAVAMALVLVVVSPWTLRNAARLGEPVLVSTNFGPNFWMGNNPETSGGYMPLPDRVEGLSETERARVLADEAKAHIRAEPGAFVLRTLTKALRLHERETIGVAWNSGGLEPALGERGLTALKLLATGYWYAVLLLAFAGSVVLVRSGGAGQLLHPVLLSWAYFTALHAVIVVEDRYHMPNTPFVALLAAVAICALQSRRTARGAARAIA